MPLRPEQARALLPRVDPARLWAGWPVGLRDGALLALLAAGLSAEEISGLRASNITSDRGNLRVTIRRYGESWSVNLSPVLGGPLLAWLIERRLWGTAEPVVVSPDGPLTPAGIYVLLHRYRQEPKAPR
jgi:integrase